MAGVGIAQFFNQHSFVILAGGLWLGLAALLLGSGLRARHVPARNIAVLLVAGAVLAGLWLALRSGEGSLAEAAEVEAALGQGQPVLVEFYSDY